MEHHNQEEIILGIQIFFFISENQYKAPYEQNKGKKKEKNRIKDKNNMIISIDAEKIFNKTQFFFKIKAFNKKNKENLPQLDKWYLQKTHS